MHSAGWLTPAQDQQIEAAVAQAERGTTAEIKVVVLRWCWIDLHAKAVEIFHRLRLDRTREHNCVLLLIVRTNRQFVIYGDRGITARVGPDYWFDVRDMIAEHFQRGAMAEGICKAISAVGDQLAKHFPASSTDTNEIEDDVVEL